MMQVTKVWRDGERLMAEPIDPTTIYQEPAQEPVAALQRVMTRLADLLDEDQFAEIEGIVTNAGVMPPAQRTWVGLTDKEMNDITCGMVKSWVMDQLARTIEAKLREKNT